MRLLNLFAFAMLLSGVLATTLHSYDITYRGISMNITFGNGNKADVIAHAQRRCDRVLVGPSPINATTRRLKARINTGTKLGTIKTTAGTLVTVGTSIVTTVYNWFESNWASHQYLSSTNSWDLSETWDDVASGVDLEVGVWIFNPYQLSTDTCAQWVKSVVSVAVKTGLNTNAVIYATDGVTKVGNIDATWYGSD
ncbi:hypothetical protein K450DRAFT_264099, partial [Umbelopsis ramanniana AG]